MKEEVPEGNSGDELVHSVLPLTAASGPGAAKGDNVTPDTGVRAVEESGRREAGSAAVAAERALKWCGADNEEEEAAEAEEEAEGRPSEAEGRAREASSTPMLLRAIAAAASAVAAAWSVLGTY